MFRRLLPAGLFVVLTMALGVWVAAQPSAAQPPPAQTATAQTPAAQDGFVPITELPPAQQLPAAPYLIAAYAFIWVALMIYLWSIWRRLGQVEREMRALDDRSRRSGPR